MPQSPLLSLQDWAQRQSAGLKNQMPAAACC